MGRLSRMVAANSTYCYDACMKIGTLIYCMRDDEVLLGLKKRGFGASKWNGYGGKPQEGETVPEAAVRELFEEAGIEASLEDLRKVAKVDFYFEDRPAFECHAFLLSDWKGEPQESEEMLPQWFKVSELPLSEMWVSDPLWLPRSLMGTKVEGRCRFNADGSVVEGYEELAVSF